MPEFSKTTGAYGALAACSQNILGHLKYEVTRQPAAGHVSRFTK